MAILFKILCLVKVLSSVCVEFDLPAKPTCPHSLLPLAHCSKTLDKPEIRHSSLLS
jgi:hypothetical protein